MNTSLLKATITLEGLKMNKLLVKQNKQPKRPLEENPEVFFSGY